MNEQYIIKNLINDFNNCKYCFDTKILNYCFTIEDNNKDNIEKVKILFNEYIHPSEDKNTTKFEFKVKNIKSASIVDKIYALKKNFGVAKRIQTFKDDTYHEEYSLFKGEVIVFFPEESKEYLIVVYKENYYFICRENMNSYLLRIIREIYLRNNENYGNIAYHGGAFAICKNGVMVCGDKAKGKTTVILEQLKKGASYLANDRVIISKNNNEYSIIYLPLSMRIGIGTISRTSCIADNINTYPWSRNQSLKVLNYEYDLGVSINEFGSGEKLEITSKEISDIFKVNLIESTSLNAIVFPEIDPNFSGMEIMPCTPQEATRLIMAQCMTPHDENWISPWLFPRNKKDIDLEKYACKFTSEMVKKVSCYTIHFGLDAYCNWDMKLF